MRFCLRGAHLSGEMISIYAGAQAVFWQSASAFSASDQRRAGMTEQRGGLARQKPLLNTAHYVARCVSPADDAAVFHFVLFLSCCFFFVFFLPLSGFASELFSVIHFRSVQAELRSIKFNLMTLPPVGRLLSLGVSARVPQNSLKQNERHDAQP